MDLLALVLVLVAALAVVGYLFETFVERRNRQRFPPPGHMVDVDGRRLHLHVMGEDKGGLTVILDSGMVSFSSNWAWIQPEIAKVARVVAYDRAGLGWSDPGARPRDVGRSANELVRLCGQPAHHRAGRLPRRPARPARARGRGDGIHSPGRDCGARRDAIA